MGRERDTIGLSRACQFEKKPFTGDTRLYICCSIPTEFSEPPSFGGSKIRHLFVGEPTTAHICHPGKSQNLSIEGAVNPGEPCFS